MALYKHQSIFAVREPFLGLASKRFTLQRHLPGAHQVALVAHQDDGHVVGRSAPPQSDAKLGGRVEAAPVADRVHDDVRAVAQQARLAAPTPVFVLTQDGKNPQKTSKTCMFWSTLLPQLVSVFP